jgi:hypothetical protein
MFVGEQRAFARASQMLDLEPNHMLVTVILFPYRVGLIISRYDTLTTMEVMLAG